jgi:uncharacterized protein YyaL (SSP411 family)
MKPILGRLLVACAIITTVALPGVTHAQENELKDHPVPYLALHGDDPIQWLEWGPEVMAEAKRSNRIVLLSIGYFSCHWCHVMQRESFQDPEIAEFANRHFLFVKVDKEMHPVLDDAMMSFAQATIGRGGWPLNVFVTPEGSPIHALLYLPPERFHEVLIRVQTVWETDGERLQELVSRLPWSEQSATAESPDASAIAEVVASGRSQMLERADYFQGGFGSQSKFPSAPQLAFLLAAQEVSPNEETREFLVTTLDAMAGLGLWDHLAGGFFRYTVDPGWEIPHFEKMLYDNASLANLYLDAGRILGRDDYLEVALGTLDFMRRFMWQNGALVSSLSAVDNNDVEGGAYLWQTDALRQLLDDDEFAIADESWNIARPAELEAGNHLRQVRSPAEVAARLDREVAEVEAVLSRIKDKLLGARLAREIPVDNKLVSGWNGLALAAYARAAVLYPDSPHGETSARLREFLTTRALTLSNGGVSLARAIVGDSPRGEGALEDYAYVAMGLYQWALFTGEPADFELAAMVARSGWEMGFDGSGWRRSPGLVRTIPETVPVVEDGPTVSPSASLLKVSRLLAEQLGDEAWLRQMEEVKGLGFAETLTAPYWYAGQLEALMRTIMPHSQ